jgi:hypothetical protein
MAAPKDAILSMIFAIKIAVAGIIWRRNARLALARRRGDRVKAARRKCVMA